MTAEGGVPFGPYLLLRRLARGGMAEVFLAQQRGLEGFDRRVAVKRILPHLADSADFVAMFLGEAKLAAQLSHPNIVHIYDFGRHDGDYFIAMEYVDGVHAGELLGGGAGPGGPERHERVPPHLVARIGADAAAALHHAHELRGQDGRPLGLVHRDVSPANLMISSDGVVKLCDFGIAKAATLSDQRTRPGTVKGKYAYMSPEQTLAAPLDGRSDVFSLGIVLWELLAGRTILPRGDAVAAMRAIRDGLLPALGQVAPEVPPALARAVTWAMQTQREQRPTAAELAQALEGFVKSSPELATSMQLGAWLRPRLRPGASESDAGTGEAPRGTQIATPTPDAAPASVSRSRPVTAASRAATPPPTPPTGPRPAATTGPRAPSARLPSRASRAAPEDDLATQTTPLPMPALDFPPNEDAPTEYVEREPSEPATIIRDPSDPRRRPTTEDQTAARPLLRREPTATMTVPPPRPGPPPLATALDAPLPTATHGAIPLGPPPLPVATGPRAQTHTPAGPIAPPGPRTPWPGPLAAAPPAPVPPWRARLDELRAHRATRIGLAIAGLLALSLLSFCIALAARSPRGAARSEVRAP